MRRVLVCLGVCASLLTTACGDSPPTETSQGGDGGALSPAELAAVQWYRAIGDRDAAAVIDGLSESARRPLDADRARRQIDGSLGRWAGQTVATVLYSERRSGTTTVFMRIDGGQRVGEALVKRETLMLALPVVFDDGRRLVHDSAWLRFQVDAHQAVERSARRGAAQEKTDAADPG
jgi:hypothetical protein